MVEEDVPGVIVVDATEVRAVEVGESGSTDVPGSSTGLTDFATADESSRFAYAFYPPVGGFDFAISEEIDAALAAAVDASGTTGLTPRVTGLDVLATNTGASEGPGVLAETLLGGLGALAVSRSSSRPCSRWCRCSSRPSPSCRRS